MRKTVLTFIVIITILFPSVEGSVGWNGEYFLISWNEINDITTDQHRDIDLVKLYDDENFTFISLRRPVALGKVFWGGSYWLVSVNPGTIPETLLYKFDEENATIIDPDFHPTGPIDWNGEFFLIGGYFGLFSNRTDALVKYDGKNITILAKEIIYSIGWNEKYWLIGARKKLLKYDGHNLTEFRTNLTMPAKLKWGRGYWLIIDEDSYGNSRLIRYTEEIFHDLTPWGLSNKRVSMLEFNGEHWLVSGYPRLLMRFDGTEFEDLTSKIGFSRNEEIKEISWNGGYWLVSTFGVEKPRILRYDGKFFDLTPKDVDALEYGEMRWNGEYWLIEKYWLSEEGQIKYGIIKLKDEKITELSFTDTEKEPKRFSLVFGVFLILLISLFLILKISKNKRV